jgi:hypothetical protein
MIYLLIPFLLAIAVAVGALFYFTRRFNQERKPFEAVAQGLGLTLTYAAPNDLMMAGIYRKYRATVITLMAAGKPSPLPCYKASVPMVNPQAKIFVVWKGSIRDEQRIPTAQLIPLKDTFPPGMLGKSNDLLFSSVLLTAEVKTAIEQFFSGVHAGELFFTGDELSLVFPAENGPEMITAALNLLADMKDSLRPKA